MGKGNAVAGGIVERGLVKVFRRRPAQQHLRRLDLRLGQRRFRERAEWQEDERQKERKRALQNDSPAFRGGGTPPLFRDDGKFDDERGALVFLALGAYVAIVEKHDLAHDGKAETCLLYTSRCV